MGKTWSLNSTFFILKFIQLVSYLSHIFTDLFEDFYFMKKKIKKWTNTKYFL